MHSYSYLLSISIDLIEARIEVYPALWRGFGMCKNTLFASSEPHSHQKSLYIGSPLVRSLSRVTLLAPPPAPTFSPFPRGHAPYNSPLRSFVPATVSIFPSTRFAGLVPH